MVSDGQHAGIGVNHIDMALFGLTRYISNGLVCEYQAGDEPRQEKHLVLHAFQIREGTHPVSRADNLDALAFQFMVYSLLIGQDHNWRYPQGNQPLEHAHESHGGPIARIGGV